MVFKSLKRWRQARFQWVDNQVTGCEFFNFSIFQQLDCRRSIRAVFAVYSRHLNVRRGPFGYVAACVLRQAAGPTAETGGERPMSNLTQILLYIHILQDDVW